MLLKPILSGTRIGRITTSNLYRKLVLVADKPTEEEVLLCYMSGIGATKIAALLGVNTSTVWHRRHRIQMKYCKYIDPNMELYL